MTTDKEKAIQKADKNVKIALQELLEVIDIQDAGILLLVEHSICTLSLSLMSLSSLGMLDIAKTKEKDHDV